LKFKWVVKCSTRNIFVLLLFLLNRLFDVKVWFLYYFNTTANILGSYYGMAQSSSSVHILFRLSYFSSLGRYTTCIDWIERLYFLYY
jgi:hypothetical protein